MFILDRYTGQAVRGCHYKFGDPKAYSDCKLLNTVNPNRYEVRLTQKELDVKEGRVKLAAEKEEDI